MPHSEGVVSRVIDVCNNSGEHIRNDEQEEHVPFMREVKNILSIFIRVPHVEND